MIAETNRDTGHADTGHADTGCETIDGTAGLEQKNSNLPEKERADWGAYRIKLEQTARTVAGQ